MSLSPEVKEKLDGWIFNLTMVVGAAKRLDPIIRRKGESDLEYQVRTFTSQRYSQDLHPLDDLLGLVHQIRFGGGVDANALLGLKRHRGSQRDYENDRMWGIFLSWMEAMRELGQLPGKKHLGDFLEDIVHASGEGWIKAKGEDISSLDKRRRAHKENGFGSGFILHGGILTHAEKDAVDYLEKYTRMRPGDDPAEHGHQLLLWEAGPLLPHAGLKPGALVWSVGPPIGDWFQTSLGWTEYDTEEDSRFY